LEENGIITSPSVGSVGGWKKVCLGVLFWICGRIALPEPPDANPPVPPQYPPTQPEGPLENPWIETDPYVLMV
jgi:hypothetical protein